MILSKCSSFITKTSRLTISQNHHIKVSLVAKTNIKRNCQGRLVFGSHLRIEFLNKPLDICLLTGFELLLLAKFQPKGLQRKSLQQCARRS